MEEDALWCRGGRDLGQWAVRRHVSVEEAGVFQRSGLINLSGAEFDDFVEKEEVRTKTETRKLLKENATSEEHSERRQARCGAEIYRGA